MARPALTGSRIRRYRIDRGIKQAELARQCDISPSYLNLIEHNRRKIGGALLNSVAAALEVDTATLSEGAGAAITGALEVAAGSFAASGREIERSEDFAGRFPGWAQLVVEQQARVSELERLVETLNDRLTHDPFLSASLHNVLSTVTAIRSTSGILATGEDIEAEWQARFHRNLYEDSQRLAESTEALVGYLDAGGDADRTLSLPQDEMEAWLSDHDWRIEAYEEGRDMEVDVVIAEVGTALTSSAARSLAARFLERYRADVMALPGADLEAAVLAGERDPMRLAARFSIDLPRAMRRMATLPGRFFKGGLPPGLVICDGSGTLTFRKPVRGFDPPRFGASCAVWPLFQALHRPLTPVSSELSLVGQDDVRFKTWSLATSEYVAGFDKPPVVESTMLLMPVLAQVGAESPPYQVGTSCRVCAIKGCPARREPSILMQSDVASSGGSGLGAM
ncbi:helix-turn-helix domain-containing protein [Boseongicola aestuarii]|uniref:Helix-turn-helix domain protein n=1 Tax=Boseongicola aestuarii TaxID=1470561 RepID=A0A238J504_9RHOB|nr:helix-turn-helix transcriptional regulator [Boseongicola aestuarii]SMX25225.1 Helix-turn-helix domain protein [Boseongicola aestuarii]